MTDYAITNDGLQDTTEVVKAKRKGKAKVYDYPRKQISGQIDAVAYDKLIADFGSPTKALQGIVETYLKTKA